MTGRLLVLAVLFAAATVWVARATHSEPVPIRKSFATFPVQIGGWIGQPGEPFEKRVLDVLGVDEYLNLTYIKPAQLPIGVYVGYYRSQREGDTMHSPLNCLPGAGWEPESKATLRIVLGNSLNPNAAQRDIVVNRYLIRKGLDRELVIYWYQSHDRVIANEYASRLHMVLDAARTNRTDAALVRVITPVLDGPTAESQAESRAVEFVTNMFPVLHDYLPS